jgi:predicted RNA-binding protein with PIN domain
MQVLVVDGANVVGSRPDGWWRDRAGAARRLQERLVASRLPYDEVVLVLEGEARDGCPAGWQGHLLTIHAPRSGDDAIVDIVGERMAGQDQRRVLVVTADRALRKRVEATGASTLGPSWLLERF